MVDVEGSNSQAHYLRAIELAVLGTPEEKRAWAMHSALDSVLVLQGRDGWFGSDFDVSHDALARSCEETVLAWRRAHPDSVPAERIENFGFLGASTRFHRDLALEIYQASKTPRR